MISDENSIALEKQSQEVFTLASVYTVATTEQYQFAAEELKNIKAGMKAAEKMRKEATGPLDAAKKTIMDWFRPIEDRYSQAETKIKTAMLTYQKEQERQRLISEAQAKEAARKEQERIDAIALSQAEKALENHDTETANAIISAVPTVRAAPIPLAVPKIAGISTREIWKYRVINEKLIPDKYKIVNEKMLGEVARSTKGALAVSGVEFYSETTMAGSRQ
jgi:hypothetical protein